jgi:hypothetical protein
LPLQGASGVTSASSILDTLPYALPIVAACLLVLVIIAVRVLKKTQPQSTSYINAALNNVSHHPRPAVQFTSFESFMLCQFTSSSFRPRITCLYQSELWSSSLGSQSVFLGMTRIAHPFTGQRRLRRREGRAKILRLAVRREEGAEGMRDEGCGMSDEGKRDEG